MVLWPTLNLFFETSRRSMHKSSFLKYDLDMSLLRDEQRDETFSKLGMLTSMQNAAIISGQIFKSHCCYNVSERLFA